MTPAFRLIAACCRWPADAERAAAVGRAAALVADWDEVVRLAERHRVEPLVVNGLTGAGVNVPPALAAAVLCYRALNLRDIAETLKIAAALDEAKIEHRFLKGAALGVAAYGSPLLKRSWDIDLLVLPGDAVAAAAHLTRLGYRPVMPPRPFNREEFQRWSLVSKEAEFRAPSGATVELHWRVSDHPQLLAAIDAHSVARIVPLLGHHGVAALADDANLAYLAVHGSAHGWFRLKWIADFNALLESIDPVLREETIRGAARLGVGRSLAAALALARQLFGDGAIPPASPPGEIARASLAALEEPDERAAAARGTSIRWRLAEGVAFRLAEARIRLRGVLDRLDFPLPRSLQFLYPLLRIPFWLIRQSRKIPGNRWG